jgi:hypothetical protein
MKPLNVLIAAAAAVCAVNAAFADDACKSGERKLDSNAPCMPEKLVDYLYCLQQSGGGKIEFTSKEGSDNSSALQITLGGKASGVIVKGDASGSYSSSEAAKATKELEAKLDPSLTANCKKIADEITQCKTVTRTYSQSRPSKWERTNWSETLNPPLDLQVAYNERIIGGNVETQGSGVIFVSAVTISSDRRSAHAQCSAQNDANSYGLCRIVATLDATVTSTSCP